VDSGTTPLDMDIVNNETAYVTSISAHGDTSTYTALGVKAGIDAAVRTKLGRDLDGIHIAIQGLGQVGHKLAQLCAADGAQLTVADTNNRRVQQVVEEFGAHAAAPDAIFAANCDVIAPCALGAVINSDTIGQINAKIIAGAANNQLSSPECGQALHHHGILYAPDYVINAGGLIYAAGLYDGESSTSLKSRIETIGDTLTEIFERSLSEDRPTSAIADQVAHERLIIQ
jgi:leucine dehydrogenase